MEVFLGHVGNHICAPRNTNSNEALRAWGQIEEGCITVPLHSLLITLSPVDCELLWLLITPPVSTDDFLARSSVLYWNHKWIFVTHHLWKIFTDIFSHMYSEAVSCVSMHVRVCLWVMEAIIRSIWTLFSSCAQYERFLTCCCFFNQLVRNQTADRISIIPSDVGCIQKPFFYFNRWKANLVVRFGQVPLNVYHTNKTCCSTNRCKCFWCSDINSTLGKNDLSFTNPKCNTLISPWPIISLGSSLGMGGAWVDGRHHSDGERFPAVRDVSVSQLVSIMTNVPDGENKPSPLVIRSKRKTKQGSPKSFGRMNADVDIAPRITFPLTGKFPKAVSKVWNDGEKNHGKSVNSRLDKLALPERRKFSDESLCGS